ncbi:polysaccharide deacetylase family protein [Actinomycetaceae bacterium L2_0104]
MRNRLTGALFLAGSLMLAGCTSSSGTNPSESATPTWGTSSTASSSSLHVETLDTPGTTALENSPGFIDLPRQTDAFGAPVTLTGVRAPEALHAPVQEWTDAQAELFTAEIGQLPTPSDASLEMTPSRCGAAGSILCYVIYSQTKVPHPAASPEPAAPTISTSPSAPSHPTETATPADAAHPDASPSPSQTPTSQVSLETREEAKAWITDFEKGTVVDSLTLLSDEGRDALSALITEHLVSEGKIDSHDGAAAESADSSASPADPTASEEHDPAQDNGSEIFDAVFLDEDGALTVLVSQGTLLPEGEGITSYRISEEREGGIAELLTPDGATLRDALTSGAELASIPETPVDCSVFSCVALTFDDGPGPYTAELLDTLKEKDVKATFFLVGRSAASDPAMVSREAQEGHVVANHSWSHPSLPTLSSGTMAAEIEQTDQAIEDAGAPRPLLVRPPYGDKNATLLSLLGQRGQAAVLWDVDTMDWKNRNVSKNIETAVEKAHPGAIILMHDIHPESVEAVPEIIDRLESQGYIFVTVPELVGGDVSQYAGMSIYSQHNIR